MWQRNHQSLWVAGMGLLFIAGCSRFVLDVKPQDADHRAMMETGYREQQVLKPVLPPDEPELSFFDDRDMAADALGRIGTDAIWELRKALGSPDPDVRRYAARALAQAGPDAAPAVPELTKMLDDPHPELRRMAARALGQVGPAAKDAVPALIRVLGEHSPTTVPAPQITPPAVEKATTIPTVPEKSN